MPAKKKYKTEEERIEATRLSKEKYRRKKGIKPKRKFNSEEEKQQAKKEGYIKWKKNNPETYKEYQKRERNKNKEKQREYQKDYRKKNKEKNIILQKIWRKENPDKLKIIYKRFSKKKRKSDLKFKLESNVKSIVYKALKRKSYSKKSRTYEILGCSYEEFKIYIEKQFESWMNWENYGRYKSKIYNYGWDIDHIIPLSNTKCEEDVIKLNHYTNLQPLCSYTNRVIKRDKL